MHTNKNLGLVLVIINKNPKNNNLWLKTLVATQTWPQVHKLEVDPELQSKFVSNPINLGVFSINQVCAWFLRTIFTIWRMEIWCLGRLDIQGRKVLFPMRYPWKLLCWWLDGEWWQDDPDLDVQVANSYRQGKNGIIELVVFFQCLHSYWSFFGKKVWQSFYISTNLPYSHDMFTINLWWKNYEQWKLCQTYNSLPYSC